MKEIIVSNQQELDALPLAFEEYTRIIIKSTTQTVIVRRARENSSVVARGNSSVVAWENSSVVARENSSVVGYELAVVIVFSCLLLKLYHLSTAFLRGVKKTEIKTFKKAKTANVILQPATFKHTKKSYLEINKPDKDGYLTLFKSVNPKNNRDFRTDTIEYKVGSDVICPDWDPNPKRECGGGLHLSQTAMTAYSYNNGKLLKCKAHKDDVVVFSDNVSKVRCKKVTVLEEVNLRGVAICK